MQRSGRQGCCRLNDGPRHGPGCADTHTVLVAPKDARRPLKHAVADPHPVRLLLACTQNNTWRHYMLNVQNLDPKSVDELTHKCDVHIHQAIHRALQPAPQGLNLSNVAAFRRIRRTPAPNRPDNQQRRPASHGRAAANPMPTLPRNHRHCSPKKQIWLRR